MATNIKAPKLIRNIGLILIITLPEMACGSIGNLYTYNGNGYLYSHKIVPLTHHYFPIETGQINKDASGDDNQLSYRNITLEAGNNAIGEISRKAGIGTIYYADLETQSVLFGLWTRYKVHIYGKALPPKNNSPKLEDETHQGKTP